MTTNKRLVRTQKYVSQTIQRIRVETARNRRSGTVAAGVVGITLVATGFSIQAHSNSVPNEAGPQQETAQSSITEATPLSTEPTDNRKTNANSDTSNSTSIDTTNTTDTGVSVESHTDENGTHTDVTVDGEPVTLPNGGNGSLHATIPTDSGDATVRVSERNTNFEGRNYNRSSSSVNVTSTSRSDDGSSRSSSSTYSSNSTFSYQRNN